MRGKVLMLQGTMSSVGKSLLVAALCRILAQDGWRVAPFKAQNMALNAAVTADGGEVGRAQAMQADAAGVPVTVEMNPILLKPEGAAHAQIIVRGKPWQRLPAYGYAARKRELWSVVTTALDTLREQYEVVVIEGAGSAAELNLKADEIVNMAVATYAAAPVLLVGDIDRGGIFAQLIGTVQLLEAHERRLLRGLIVNKFRGDARLFTDGVTILEQRSGLPVLGVIPFLPTVGLPDEDSVALDDLPPTPRPPLPDHLRIAVLRLPHISNFDDFDPLRAIPNVNVQFVRDPTALGHVHLIIVPGTKTTIADLHWLHTTGWADTLHAAAQAGTAILGICGGYQMLGQAIHDPASIESDQPYVTGLGLLPVETYFYPTKQTCHVQGVVHANRGLFAGAQGLPCHGYEIHMGQTRRIGDEPPILDLHQRGATPISESDGAIACEGWVAGTYLHGLFDNDALRHTLLSNLAARAQITLPAQAQYPLQVERERQFNRLAQSVRQYLDYAYVLRLLAEQEAG